MDENEKQPWYNDGDKAGGLAATIFMTALAVALAIVIIGGAIKLVF